MCCNLRCRILLIEISEDSRLEEYGTERKIRDHGYHGIDHRVDDGRIGRDRNKCLDRGSGLFGIGCEDRIPYILERRLKDTVKTESRNCRDHRPLDQIASRMVVGYLCGNMRNKSHDKTDDKLGYEGSRSRLCESSEDISHRESDSSGDSAVQSAEEKSAEYYERVSDMYLGSSGIDRGEHRISDIAQSSHETRIGKLQKCLFPAFVFHDIHSPLHSFSSAAFPVDFCYCVIYHWFGTIEITRIGEFYMTRYIEIYEDIRRKIVSGIYEYGSKLPSKRVTAENYGVSVITVVHAYELLMEEGYAVAREKSGYFVNYRENENFSASSPHRIIPRPAASSGADEALSFNIYARTVRRVLSEYADAIRERPDSYGCEALRIAISDYLIKNRGIRTGHSRIVIGSGAEYLYGLIVRALGRDRIYAIENPSYRKISEIYDAEGITTDKLDLGPDGIQSEQLWKTNAGVLHVTPYRSFPTGVTASAAKKQEYINWSRKKNGIIIEDDFESEFSVSRKPEETLFSKDEEGRVIYVNTFSKTIGSFMRTAYMVIPEGLEKLFREKIGFYSCSVPALEQYVLADLIENGDFVRHINRVRRKRRET